MSMRHAIRQARVTAQPARDNTRELIAAMPDWKEQARQPNGSVCPSCMIAPGELCVDHRKAPA